MHRMDTMFSQIHNFSKAFFGLIMILYHFMDQAKAGQCWAAVNRHGNCETLISSEMTREDCCQATASGPSMRGWTDETLDPGTIFYFQVIQNGIPNCKSCTTSCENVRCSRGKVCRMRHSAPKCICNPVCNLGEMDYSGPVCGSDNRSYRNLCRLRKYNCRHGRYIEVQYYGKCQSSCESVSCLNGMHCVLDQNHTPHCVPCRLKCPPARPDEKLCGSDGNTYDSLCKVRAAMCLRGRTISIAYRGPCIPSLTCDTIACPPDRVCLTDPMTGQPHCASCNPRHYCVPFLEKKTICGTDDVTYQSWCEMKIAACAQGILINTKHGGACGSNEVSQEFQPVSSESYSHEDDEDAAYYFAL